MGGILFPLGSQNQRGLAKCCVPVQEVGSNVESQTGLRKEDEGSINKRKDIGKKGKGRSTTIAEKNEGGEERKAALQEKRSTSIRKRTAAITKKLGKKKRVGLRPRRKGKKDYYLYPRAGERRRMS